MCYINAVPKAVAAPVVMPLAADAVPFVASIVAPSSAKKSATFPGFITDEFARAIDNIVAKFNGEYSNKENRLAIRSFLRQKLDEALDEVLVESEDEPEDASFSSQDRSMSSRDRSMSSQERSMSPPRSGAVMKPISSWKPSACDVASTSRDVQQMTSRDAPSTSGSISAASDAFTLHPKFMAQEKRTFNFGVSIAQTSFPSLLEQMKKVSAPMELKELKELDELVVDVPKEPKQGAGEKIDGAKQGAGENRDQPKKKQMKFVQRRIMPTRASRVIFRKS